MAVTTQDLIGEITVSGSRLTKTVTEKVLSASIDDSISQATALTMSITDNGLVLLASGMFAVGSKVTWRKQQLKVAALEVVPGENGQGQLDVTCEPAVIVDLKAKRGPKVFAKQDAVSAIRTLAGGLKVIAQPGGKVRVNIAVNGPSQGQLAETYWEAFNRWADESGAVCFEANGTIFFGKPSWIVAQVPSGPKLEWLGPARTDKHLLELPRCRMTTDIVSDPVSVTMSVHAELAEQFSAGHAVEFAGVPGFDGNYWVTGVSGPLKIDEPWTLTLAVPVDPKPDGETGAVKTATKKASKPAYATSTDEQATVKSVLTKKAGKK